MTNSLLAMHPAVQHMVLHLMNINAVKYKWSSGTGLMAGKLLHMALLFRKVNFYVSHHFFPLLVTFALTSSCHAVSLELPLSMILYYCFT